MRIISLLVELLAIGLAAALAAFLVALVPGVLAGAFGAQPPTAWGLTTFPTLVAGLCAGWWTRDVLAQRRKRKARAKTASI